MRTYLITAAVAVLVVLTSQPAIRAQQQQQQQGSAIQAQSMSILGSGGTGSQAPGGGGAGGGESGPSMSILDSPGSGALESGGFVGAGVEDVRRAMEATGARRAGQPTDTGQSRFGAGAGGRQTRRPTGRGGVGSRGRTQEIRARLRIGFNTVRPAPAQLGSRLAGRLERSSWLQTQSPMEVAFENGTAILRGTVATEHDRMLAGRIARLEPGVQRVENQLTVAGSPASPSPSDEPALQ